MEGNAKKKVDFDAARARFELAARAARERTQVGFIRAPFLREEYAKAAEETGWTFSELISASLERRAAEGTMAVPAGTRFRMLYPQGPYK